MPFICASIIPETGPAAFNVLFNPTEYRIEKGNQIAEIGVPGLGAPILQFVSGQSRTLSMELYFDTYEDPQSNVTVHTNKVYKLLEIDPSTHAPPICQVRWGDFSFRGVLDKVSGNFTLFLPDGTPVRARLSVNFREYNDVSIEVKKNPNQSADHRKSRLVQAGDSLSSIAFEEYGDPKRWRPIALANQLSDPFNITPGQVLVIPAIQ